MIHPFDTSSLRLLPLRCTSRRRFAIGIAIVGVLLVPVATPRVASAAPTAERLRPVIEATRVEHDLPALGAAVVTHDGVQALVTTGVRRRGDPTPATDDDLWHLGSCGKAVTATVIARLVEAGVLRFDQTLGESFPRLARRMPDSHRGITLRQLLSHRSGLPANFTLAAYTQHRNPTTARRHALREALETPLLHAPGSAYLYSNFGYTLAGHIAEQATGKSFETLARTEVFQPLGLSTAGFGGTGTPSRVDQPWPHTRDGRPTPTNGPAVDNLPVMSPAGTIHMSLSDWATFLAEHLKGRRGGSTFLTRDTYEQLHRPTHPPHDDDTYALGWIALPRGWAGEGENALALTHAGDNTMNRALVWAAPDKGVAFLAVTNQSGTQPALNAAVAAMLQAWSEKVEQ